MIIDPYTWHRLMIKSISNVAEDTVAITIERPDNFRFIAGQYAVVRITTPNNQQYVRQYSFSSAPVSPNLELLIQHEPGGNASGWFCNTAKAGDCIELSQPFGDFVYKEISRPALLIAGKVGIAPFLSMLRENKIPITALLYSVRTQAQICFPELLSQLPTTIITTSETQRIDATTLQPYLEKNPIIYTCGSKQFVDSITESLRELNVTDTDIHRELFTLQ